MTTNAQFEQKLELSTADKQAQALDLAREAKLLYDKGPIFKIWEFTIEPKKSVNQSDLEKLAQEIRQAREHVAANRSDPKIEKIHIKSIVEPIFRSEKEKEVFLSQAQRVKDYLVAQGFEHKTIEPSVEVSNPSDNPNNCIKNSKSQECNRDKRTIVVVVKIQ